MKRIETILHYNHHQTNNINSFLLGIFFFQPCAQCVPNKTFPTYSPSSKWTSPHASFPSSPICSQYYHTWPILLLKIELSFNLYKGGPNGCTCLYISSLGNVKCFKTICNGPIKMAPCKREYVFWSFIHPIPPFLMVVAPK